MTDIPSRNASDWTAFYRLRMPDADQPVMQGVQFIQGGALLGDVVADVWALEVRQDIAIALSVGEQRDPVPELITAGGDGSQQQANISLG
jgi:hypothetical protein